MKIYPFHLPDLDYQLSDLAPMMSQETLAYQCVKNYYYVFSLVARFGDYQPTAVIVDNSRRI